MSKSASLRVLAAASALAAASIARASVVWTWDATQLQQGAPVGAPVEVIVTIDQRVVVRTPSKVYAAPLPDILAPVPSKAPLVIPVLKNISGGVRLVPDGLAVVDPRTNQRVRFPALPPPAPLRASGASPPPSPPPPPSPTPVPVSICDGGLESTFISGRWTWDAWLESWEFRDAKGVIARLDDVLEIPTRTRTCDRTFVRTVRGVTIVDGPSRTARDVPGPFQSFAASEDGRTVAIVTSPPRAVAIERAAGSCRATPAHGVLEAAISADGRWVLAWSAQAELSVIDTTNCAIVKRWAVGPDASPPDIVSARIAADGAVTLSTLPAGSKTQPVIVQLGASGPQLCDVFPFSSHRPSGTLPSIDYVTGRRAVVHSFEGVATLEFDSPDACRVSTQITPLELAKQPRSAPPAMDSLCIADPIGQSHGWPVQPSDLSHSIGTALEYMGAPNERMHEGLDIVVDKPYLNAAGNADPEPTSIVAVPCGTASSKQQDTAAQQTIVIVKNGDRSYAYAHLQQASVPAGIGTAAVIKGAILGGVARWPDCDFHHLHYRESRLPAGATDEEIQCPLARMTPRADTTHPTIEDVFVLEDGASSFVPAGECMKKKADLLVKTWDVAEGGRRIGVQTIKTVVTPVPAGQATLLWGWDFSPLKGVVKIMGATTTADAVRIDDPFGSVVGYCPTSNKTFFIHAATLQPAAVGTFDATNWKFSLAPGNYSASITAVDFNSNVTTFTKPFCVAVVTP